MIKIGRDIVLGKSSVYIATAARFTNHPACIIWAKARQRLTESREVDGSARPKISIVEVLLLQRFANISEFEEAPSRLVRGFLFCFPASVAQW